MANRRGGISIVRLSVFAAILGGVIIVAAAITVFTDQAARRVPLEIEPYPGAADWGESNVQPASRNIFYLTPDTPEQVAIYYQQKMEQHYGNNDERCVRIPETGDAPGAANNPSASPFVYRCMFDNPGLNSSQNTLVEIYPGHADPNPALDAEGLTVIKYEQQWQR